MVRVCQPSMSMRTGCCRGSVSRLAHAKMRGSAKLLPLADRSCANRRSRAALPVCCSPRAPSHASCSAPGAAPSPAV